MLFLPGPPEKALEIAKKFSSYEKITEQREFVAYKGEIEGKNVCVASMGIECPSVAIVVEEQLDIVRLTAEFTENAEDIGLGGLEV